MTVTDTSLAPVRARVDLHGTVTWRNRGRARHRVVSQTGAAWPAFTLLPGRSKTVRFPRAGRFAYTVDGRRCGIVFVAVAVRGGCTVTAVPTTPTSGTRFYEYAVEVTGRIHNRGQVFSAGRLEHDWTRTYAWTGKWERVRVKVVLAGGGTFVLLNATAPQAVAGTVVFTETYDHYLHPHALFPPDADCEGTISATLPAGLGVGASGPILPSFDVTAQLTLAAGEQISSAEAAEWAAACNSWSPPSLLTADQLAGPQGTIARPSDELLTVEFERKGGQPRRAPVSALLAGQGFTLDSGPHTFSEPSCEGDCSGEVQVEERYTVRFTPRR